MTSTHGRTSRRCLTVKRLQIRLPWLLKLHEVIQRERSSGSDALLVCSALKHQYRRILLHGSKALTSPSETDQEIFPAASPDVFFLFLRGDYEFIYQRMVARRGHYMKADMLRSQFDTLETPSDEENVLTLDIQRGIDDMAVEVERHLINHTTTTDHMGAIAVF
ncbi:probable gluconokinase isoform X3 [Pelmatolapia mariae]|uniref:probable gluconokinase isoform X3 n=1 Tax=Pelmatolapia mariae TaxID=158779 RepID=UPI003211F14B